MDFASQFRIAEFLITRPSRSPYITVAEARNALGDAYTDAIRDHYLVVNEDLTGIQVTNQASKWETLRHVFEFESELEVGDEVEVAANGRPYSGAVKERDPSGRVKLSFGADGTPPDAGRDYNRDEVRLTGRLDTDKPGSRAVGAGAGAPGTQKSAPGYNPYRTPEAPGL